jgi:hypothetical protein
VDHAQHTGGETDYLDKQLCQPVMLCYVMAFVSTAVLFSLQCPVDTTSLCVKVAAG